ncbi:MAG: 2,3-diphosphoglycerate-dependent phosphoglycerate mutase [Microthrixaceae bacterium]
MELVLLRHGQSEWNAEGIFTGWVDVELSDVGLVEAIEAGGLLAEAGVHPDVVHTSLQKRAIRTAEEALRALDRQWIPVQRHWRLNERHYGALQGRSKAEVRAEVSDEQFHQWRRGFDTPPPAVDFDSEYHPVNDARYADVPSELLPGAESLSMVLQRVLPYWFDRICPDLHADRCVLVSAHGNSLRALVKHLEGISDDDIAEVNIPTGVPMYYELGADYRPRTTVPLEERYLGDPSDVAAAAEAVAAQGQ